MKKFIVAFALLIGIGSFNNPVEAQSINISINVGRQPAWGPIGYDYAGYYYFPDIDCYYDVNMALFYYFDRGRWISASYLPYAYRNYDLYRLYKVVLNVSNPWRYHHSHYRDYYRYRGHNHRQVIIRDSRDHRYRDSRKNKVVWYSKNKSQRDYRYDYNNYNYRDNRNHSNKNYNNSPNRNNSDRKYDNNRKDNNRSDKKYNNNSSRDNKNNGRTNYNNNNRNESKGKKENSVRPSTNRNSKDNKSTRSSSGNSGYRLTSNTKGSR